MATSQRPRKPPAPPPDPWPVVPMAFGLILACMIGSTPGLVRSFYVEPRMAAVQEEELAVKAELDKFQLKLGDLKAIADQRGELKQRLQALQRKARAHP